MLKKDKNKKINHLKVSIIIPCRNEERYIAKCLDSIIKQDFPKNKLEVLVVDGMSSDKTLQILKKYDEHLLSVKILKNPKKITPCAFNIGIKYSKADFILIMGAHSVYKKDYISKCIKYLNQYKVDNVGGISIAIPGNKGLLANSIAIVLAHPFGVGNAYYRIGVKEPKYVDTVWGGCFNRKLFEENGLFDEELIRNQDDEFNLRLIKNGGKILLFPDIISYYYSRESLGKFCKMFFQYSYYKPLTVRKIGGLLTWRQIVPSLFISALGVSLLLSFFIDAAFWLFFSTIGLYLVIDLFFSMMISLKKKKLKLLPFLAISFIALHFSYGIGYLKGILDFIVFNGKVKGRANDLPLTR